MLKFVRMSGTCSIVLLMGVVVLVFLAPRFGWSVDAVLSGSMEPTLRSGGIAVTRPVDPAEVQAGDIITFRSPLTGELTSHRVIEAGGGTSPVFRTQGDANQDPDPFSVRGGHITGRVCFHVPYAGYAAMFVKTPPGLVLTLVVPGLIVIITEMVNIWRAMSALEKKRAGVRFT